MSVAAGDKTQRQQSEQEKSDRDDWAQRGMRFMQLLESGERAGAIRLAINGRNVPTTGRSLVLSCIFYIP